jgi:hypothetical protein
LREESKKTKKDIEDIEEAVEDKMILDDDDKSGESEVSGEDLMEDMEGYLLLNVGIMIVSQSWISTTKMNLIKKITLKWTCKLERKLIRS